MISLGIFGIDAVVFAIVALLTGAGLVWLAMWLAGLISPRSFNPQKGEAYECGIPPAVNQWPASMWATTCSPSSS